MTAVATVVKSSAAVVAAPYIDAILPTPTSRSTSRAQDMGNDLTASCLMSVDGTDFCIPQNGKAVKGNAFGSHKYAGKSALRYELGVDILAGKLVWIQGPYPAG